MNELIVFRESVEQGFVHLRGRLLSDPETLHFYTNLNSRARGGLQIHILVHDHVPRQKKFILPRILTRSVVHHVLVHHETCKSSVLL